MKRLIVPAALAAALSFPAFADNAHKGHAHGAATAASAPAADFAQGEVRKVDKGAGKVTLKHGPIPNLDMPPMTMVFKAKDPAMLDKLKVGDAIGFKAEKIDGAYTVTEVKPKS